MCGIFGVITKNQNAPELTFKGLKDIEYRGYDSWGIASWKIETGNWKIEKKIGFLPSSIFHLPSSISLGHTRWATHGGVTKANAHPHIDCSGKIILVHNGIVENYLELKKTLKNHTFKSQTDTEIIAHLLEDQLKIDKDLEKAFKKVFSKLTGLNAFVASDGKSLVAGKTGSPLVLGISETQVLVASDPNAILPHTSNLHFMEDGEITQLTSLSVKLIHPPGVNLKFIKVPWQYSSSTLKNYPHFMLKEISEQPQVLKTIAQDSKEVEKLAKMIKKAYGTYFLGCGTASYACLLGVYLFSKFAKKHVNFAIGSEFTYTEDFLKKESLLVAVSQSGESIDTLEPVLKAKEKGAKTAALVNVLGSTLFREVDYPVLLKAGPEKAVASTKAFIAMIAYMILLSFSLQPSRLKAKKIILESAKEIKSILKRKSLIKSLAQKIKSQKNIYVLGRGLSYPIAMEAALKIKEVSYIHAEGFASGELKHGVIALIEKGTPVIVFVPEDETKGASLANAMEVKVRGAYVIGVGAEENPVFDFFFKVKDVGASSVIPHAVFAQTLAYFLSISLKHNPDKPRNLAKSVVVR